MAEVRLCSQHQLLLLRHARPAGAVVVGAVEEMTLIFIFGNCWRCARLCGGGTSGVADEASLEKLTECLDEDPPEAEEVRHGTQAPHLTRFKWHPCSRCDLIGQGAGDENGGTALL